MNELFFLICWCSVYFAVYAIAYYMQLKAYRDGYKDIDNKDTAYYYFMENVNREIRSAILKMYLSTAICITSSITFFVINY
jgi:hypothetical protein